MNGKQKKKTVNQIQMSPLTQLQSSILLNVPENFLLFCFFFFLSVRISGNAASDKNIKDGVCAQIEKNFAKAKWKVALLIYNLWFMVYLLYIWTSSFFYINDHATNYD